MVLLRNSREKLISRARAEARAEGKAEGKAEGEAIGKAEGKAIGVGQMHAQWSAWNRRRLDAGRNGESFNEPPPAPNDIDVTHGNHR